MDQRALHGVVPMLPTPFHDDGSLALAEIPCLVEFARHCGSTGVATLGLGGESGYLTTEERRLVCEAVLRAAPDLPTIVGCTAEDTATSAALARHAAEHGATAIMVAPPARPGQSRDELANHYGLVARAAHPAALMLQDAPTFLGIELGPVFAAELADRFDNVRYAKTEATPAGVKVGAMAEALLDSAVVFGGHGGLHFLEELDAGAVGTIPGLEVADRLVAVWQAYYDGRGEDAAEHYRSVLPLLVYMFQSLGFFLACTRRILAWRGALRALGTRHPGATLDERGVRGLKRHARLAGLTELTNPDWMAHGGAH